MRTGAIMAIILLSSQSFSSMVQAQPSVLTSDSDAPLHLICDGTCVDTRVNVATASAYGSGGWANATGYARKASNFDDELEIEINGGIAKARLPRRIVSKLHGGDNGWFEIKKLSVGPDEITGKVAMNFTNAPYLRINRVSGAVSIDGRDGSFSGRCRNYSPETTRAF